MIFSLSSLSTLSLLFFNHLPQKKIPGQILAQTFHNSTFYFLSPHLGQILPTFPILHLTISPNSSLTEPTPLLQKGHLAFPHQCPHRITMAPTPKPDSSASRKPATFTRVLRKPAHRSAPLRRSARISVRTYRRNAPLLTADERITISVSSTDTASSPSSPPVSPLTSSLRRAVDTFSVSTTATSPSIATRTPPSPQSPSSHPSPHSLPTTTKALDGIAHNQAVLQNTLTDLQTSLTRLHQKVNDLIRLSSVTHHCALKGVPISAAEHVRCADSATHIIKTTATSSPSSL